jgi:integrase/recombinase XerD
MACHQRTAIHDPAKKSHRSLDFLDMRRTLLITTFLDYLRIEKGLSSNTIKSYGLDLTRLQEWTNSNNKILRGLNGRDIDRHIGSLSRKQLAATSIARALSTIRTFYEFLVNEGEVPSNPTDDIPAPKKTQPLPHVLTTEQVSQLLQAADQVSAEGLRDRALLELLYATGLRVTEAITLRHRDLDLHPRFVTCHGKGNRERQVPISPQAISSIRRYSSTKSPREAQRNEILFLNQGEPLTRQFAWAIVNDYATKAGLTDVTPHTLRHSFATHLLENDVPTNLVQRLLGHEYINTTELYLTVTPKRRRATYDKHHPRARAYAR